MQKQKYEEGWSTKYREIGVLSQLRKILEAIIKRKAMIMCQINESHKVNFSYTIGYPLCTLIYASTFLPTRPLVHSSPSTFVFQFLYQIWSYASSSSLYFSSLWINVQTPLCGVQILHDLAIYCTFLQLLPPRNHLCHALLVILQYLAWASLMQTASDCHLLFLHYKVELDTPTPCAKIE